MTKEKIECNIRVEPNTFDIEIDGVGAFLTDKRNGITLCMTIEELWYIVTQAIDIIMRKYIENE